MEEWRTLDMKPEWLPATAHYSNGSDPRNAV